MGITNDEIPNELSMVLTASIGFLVGTKFTPYGGYTEKTKDAVKSTDEIVVKEQP
jgi:hypothetical protein